MANFLSINSGNMSDSGVFGSTLTNYLTTDLTSPVRIDIYDRFSDVIYGENTNIVGIQLNNISITNISDTDIFTLTIRKSDNTEFSENFNAKDFTLSATGVRNVTWDFIKLSNPFYLSDTEYFTYSLKCNNASTSAFFYGTFFYKDTVNNATLTPTNISFTNDSPIETTTYVSSLVFNGNSFITGDRNDDWYYFGTGDFTIEVWIKPSNTSTGTVISYCAEGGAQNVHQQGWGIAYDGNGDVTFNDLDAYARKSFTRNGVIINQWNFIAVSRVSGVVSLYINGNLVGTTNIFNNVTFGGSRVRFKLGQGTNFSPYQYTGLTFNPRITRGLGRYTANTIPVPTDVLRADNQFVTFAFEYLYRLNQQIVTDNSPSLLNPLVLTKSFSANIPLLSADDPFNDPAKDSLLFDGSVRVLGIDDPTGTDFTIGIKDFTVDLWTKPNSTAIGAMFTNAYFTDRHGIWMGQAATPSNNFQLALGGGTWTTDRTISAFNVSFSALSASTLNNWSQLTLTRNHGVVSVYRNGQIIDRYPNNTSLTNLNSAAYIGGRFISSQLFNGLISNVHFVNGTSLYPIDFTPPASALSANSNTFLMMNTQDVSGDRVHDTSQNNLFFYNNRGTLTARNPFNDPTKNSLRFDGVSNRLKIRANTTNDFVLSTGDFTLDFWVYPFNSTAAQIICTAMNSNAEGGIYIQNTTTANQLAFGFGTNTYNTNNVSALNTLNPYLSAPLLTTWSQLTLSRKRNIISFYRNGQIISSVPDGGTGAAPLNLTNTNNWISIGGRDAGSGDFSNVLISNVRLVKGTNLYEIDYTVSSSPISATPETTLLLRSSGASAADVSNYANTIYNNRGTLTANNPFNDPNERSLYYDGTTNRLRVLTAGNAFNLSANNFTVELFVYPVSSRTCAYLTTADPNDWQGIYIGQGKDTEFVWAVGTGTSWFTNRVLSAASLSGKWNHITLNRANSTFYATINGAVTDVWNFSGAPLTLTNTNSSISIGGRSIQNLYSNTYISNVNFINGSAKYPLTSFATPTVALTTVSGTVCLVNGTGTLNGSNGNFIDTSSSGYVVSSFGSASQSNFGPNNGGNGIFNGSTDYLVVRTPNTGLDFGLNDFTVELWVYPSTGYTNTSRHFIDTRNSTGTASGSWAFGTGLNNPTDGRISWVKNNTIPINVLIPLSTNTWNHLAYVRNSSSTIAALFVNGMRVTSAFDTTNYNFSSLSAVVGSRFNAASGFFDGSLSDVRVINGTALYDVNLDTYTIPDAPLTNITNTKLLLSFANATIFDQSRNNGFITYNGATTRNTTTKYNPGSLFFNSSGNLVSNSTRNIGLSTSDFTIEGWFYSVSSSPASIRTLFTVGNSHNDGVMLRMDGLFVSNSATAVTNSAWISGAGYTANFPVSTWRHIAVTRKNGYVSTWVDGKRTTTNYVPRDLGGSKKLTIGGASHVLNQNFFGYIDDFRILNGVCLYDTNFQVPSSQIVPDANTRFLLNNSNYEQFTNTYSLCSPFGFGNSESYFMNGSTDALYTVTSANNFGNNNFSIEFWAYPLSMATESYWIRTDSRNNNGIFIGYTSPTVLLWGFSNNGVVALQKTITVSNVLSTWNHFVFTKNNNVYTLYRNGSAIDSGYSTSSPNNGTSALYIGANPLGTVTGYTNGYISNVRVISGTNVFSSNFTPATAEFENVPNTRLLLNESSYDRYTRVDSLCSPFGFGVSDSVYLSGDRDAVYTFVDSRSLTGTNCTVECWFYPISITGNSPIIMMQTPIDGFGVNFTALSPTSIQWLVGNGGWLINKTVTTPSLLSAWNHMALVKNGYVYTLYLNGSAIDGDYTVTTPTFNNNRIQIGSYWIAANNSPYFNGYISNVRILSGVALYDSNFTPATADFTPVANTKLLVNPDTQNRYLTLSSLSSPFEGGAGSNYFSGTQYMTAYHPSNFNFGTNDFTIEFWVYPTKLSVFSTARSWFNNATPVDGGGIFIGYGSNTQFHLALGTGWGIVNSASINAIAGTTLFNKWTHVCLTRKENTFTLYQNGSSVWSVVNSGVIPNLNNAVTFGGRRSDNNYSSFYLANARIVNGTCLYDANFTPTDISSQNLFIDVVLQYDSLYPTITYEYTDSRLDDIFISGFITNTVLETCTITADSMTLKNVTVGNKGILTFPLNESKKLRIAGRNGLFINKGGVLNIGTKDNPIPSGINHELSLVGIGLTATNGGIINTYGSYKLPYTTVNTDVLSGSKVFTVVDNVSTNWLSGDKVAVVHVSPSATNYDILTLSSFNENNSFNTIQAITMAHSALSSNNLSYLNDIPNIVNLTRNVNINGGSSTLRSSIFVSSDSKVNINNTSFENLGRNVDNNRGFTITTNSSGYVILSGSVFYGDGTSGTQLLTNNVTTPLICNLSSIGNVYAFGTAGIYFNSISANSLLIKNNFILSCVFDGISLINLSGSEITVDNNYLYDNSRNGMLIESKNAFRFPISIYNLYSIGNTSNGLRFLSSHLTNSNNINLIANKDSGLDGTLITGNYQGINSLYNSNHGISAIFGTVSSAVLSNINASNNTNAGLIFNVSNGVTTNTYNVTANSNNKGVNIFSTGSIPLNLNNTYLSSNREVNLEIASIYGTISGLSSFENSVELSLSNNSTLIDGICSFVTNDSNPFVTVPITTNGIVSRSNLSPYSDPNTTSMAFRGTPNSDYVIAPAFNISTDFTLEAWARFATLADDAILDARSGSVAEPLWFGIISGKLRFYTGNGVHDLYASVATISANVWQHLVWMRTNSRVYGFVDGVKLIDSPTAGTNFANNVFVNTSFIGRAKDGTPTNKFISNLRISNAAIYPTTGFTAPSSAPFKNTKTTVFLLQDPYSYGMNGTNIFTDNISITGGTNYSETYIRNSNIVRNNSSLQGYPISLDSVTVSQFFLENSELSGNNGDVGLLNTRNRVVGSLIFNNCKFSSTPLPFGLTTYQPNVSRSTGLAFTNYNKISSNNFSYLPEGTRIIDTIVYDVDSPDQISERLIPNTTTAKLRSGSKYVAVDNGEFSTVSVLVSKSADYNGSNPRLVLKRNAAFGVALDTVLDTLSTTALSNTFYRLQGSTPSSIGFTALEFYVDCDGTIGYINVDSWNAV